MKRLMLVSLCALTFGLGSTGNIKAMGSWCSSCCSTVGTDLELVAKVALPTVTDVAQVAITTAIQTLETEGGSAWTALITASQSGNPVQAGQARTILVKAHVLLNDDYTVRTVVKACLNTYLAGQKASASTSSSTSSSVAMSVVSTPNHV
jgi:hypothetical protein